MEVRLYFGVKDLLRLCDRVCSSHLPQFVLGLGRHHLHLLRFDEWHGCLIIIIVSSTYFVDDTHCGLSFILRPLVLKWDITATFQIRPFTQFLH